MAARDALSIAEVAERLGVSETTIRRLVRRGELPSFKVGTQIRIRVRDYEAWMEKGGTAPKPFVPYVPPRRAKAAPTEPRTYPWDELRSRKPK